ncbi:MAG: cysteine--tRNA ligase, partial [Betaproteobacteria bacterium]|nr:cysteine--tRNA ligase [Betaproteobacteria bacterium]
RRQGQLSDDAIEAKVIERGLAKQARDFARADFLRAELAEAGIVLEDGPQGTRWRRQ